MNFIMGLPKTLEKFDFIWVVVDWLVKLAYFILIMVSYDAKVGKDLCERDSEITLSAPLYHLRPWYLVYI